ncbi:hypothetical protein METBIDRAFT_10817 [Metschnikowia bicuspidata var. bicuspidata NRRL YB-4993]|uniref:RRN6 beta-propeller domain-containing protein n=1 Tax=Metschnikowia bicuspidata var. bicuspidata NRRL YB-4993 TaxID=869754 RepID=A0A1A0HD53_9ASCO|nr:hypothetical protein METBIDRAFT_10817 [Metschnikowia bicuspidata var. bicuspidata NRRL YB-4993]OBA21900.1 hypothetical protein METBIDRAFT_10817 [Metschnikowia bicuspidata var. bicuspidata NRRL YB-4993]
MWPAKKTLGTRLTYGLHGPPVMLPAPVPAGSEAGRPVVHPRLPDLGPKFHEIVHSAVEISPEASPTHVRLRRVEPALLANLHDELAAPTPLLDAADAAAEPFHQPQAQYPIKGPLAASLFLGTGAYSEPVILGGRPYYPKAKNSVVSVRCLAFASSAYTLKVVPLMPKRKNFFDRKNPQNSQKALFRIPHISEHAVECTFPFEILQIEACLDNKVLLARGLQHIAVLTISWSNDPGEKRVRLKNAFTISHHGGNIVHLALGHERLVFLDSEGTYSAYSFGLREVWEYQKTAGGKVPNFDPSDTSAWRRLCWPSASEYMYYFTRKSVARVHIKTAVARKLITFHVWLRAQDFTIFGSDLFLLTSQEIVWVRLTKNGGFSRLLSWKHYLDNKDKTLKMTACYCKTGDMYVCLVYSSITPLAVMYTFGTRNEYPSILRDPYIFCRDLKDTMYLFLMETPSILCSQSPILALAEMTNQYRLTYKLYSSQPHREFRIHNQEPTRHPMLETWSSKLHPLEAKWLFQLFDGKVLNAKPSPETTPLLAYEDRQGQRFLPENEETAGFSSHSPSLNSNKVADTNDEKEVNIVQDYAFKLGADIRQFFYPENQLPAEAITLTAHRSLATIAEAVPLEVNDLEEFESMLTQLGEYYASQGLTLLPFASEALGCCGTAFLHIDHLIQEITRAMGEFAPEGVPKAAAILATSLIKAHGDFPVNYIDCIDEETEGFPDQLLDTLGEWEVALPSSAQNGKTHHLLPKSSGSRRDGISQSQSLLRRALTQNSQREEVTPLSDPKWSSDSDSDNLVDSRSDAESSNSPAPSQRPSTESQPSVQLSLPPSTLLMADHEPDFPSLSQPKSEPQIQHSQRLPDGKPKKTSKSQPSSQSSLSLKRPGSQSLLIRKKKKTKGGFA